MTKNRIFRSSHRRYSLKKGVSKNFAKFKEEHLVLQSLCNKVAGLRSATLLKKRLQHMCFPVNFVTFLRTPSLQNTSGNWFCIFKIAFRHRCVRGF